MSTTNPLEKTPSLFWEMTILGCGTSTGVPLLFCECSVCKSVNPRNHRLRTSAWMKFDGRSILIDTSTDLRQQALREKIPRIDAILFTHPHADHVSGIDEIRSFNYVQKERIPAFGNHWTCSELRNRFPYLFSSTLPIEGGGIAGIDLHEFDAKCETLEVAGTNVTPIALNHGSQECIGYRFGDVAYLTDCSSISEEAQTRLQKLDLLVLDCLRLLPHSTHFSLAEALEMVERLKPQRTVLTHLGHDFDYELWSAKLPAGVSLAYDGMKLSGNFPLPNGEAK
ncbi:MAG: MBL fold metallo-hydrolase [Cryobacterium sp.]|nr:MBL fold metallo-hydrolase [Oligoflexia bacterium]